MQATNKHTLISQYWALNICELQQATISLDSVWIVTYAAQNFSTCIENLFWEKLWKDLQTKKAWHVPPPNTPGNKSDVPITRQAAVLDNRQQDLNVGGN